MGKYIGCVCCNFKICKDFFETNFYYIELIDEKNWLKKHLDIATLLQINSWQ